MPIALTRFNFSSHEGWFDMRDLGAALDHEEPLPSRIVAASLRAPDCSIATNPF
jgi:hypothetical protein